MAPKVDILKIALLFIITMIISCGPSIPEEVEIAYESLPEEVKKFGPYIDNISKHQALYLKYH